MAYFKIEGLPEGERVELPDGYDARDFDGVPVLLTDQRITDADAEHIKEQLQRVFGERPFLIAPEGMRIERLVLVEEDDDSAGA